MNQLLIVLSFAVLFSCSDVNKLSEENEKLLSEIENLRGRAEEQKMQADLALEEAIRQRQMAEAASEEARRQAKLALIQAEKAQELELKLKKCKGQ